MFKIYVQIPLFLEFKETSKSTDIFSTDKNMNLNISLKKDLLENQLQEEIAELEELKEKIGEKKLNSLQSEINLSDSNNDK